MRNTQNTKRQTNLFLSRLIDNNLNKGVANESKIYGHHYAKIVIYSEKMLRIYYDHWWPNVMDGATVIEWAMNFKQRFCNALAVEHKYSDSLPLD